MDDVFLYNAHTFSLVYMMCVGTLEHMSTSIEHELTKRALESVPEGEESRTTLFQGGELMRPSAHTPTRPTLIQAIINEPRRQGKKRGRDGARRGTDRQGHALQAKPAGRGNKPATTELLR